VDEETIFSFDIIPQNKNSFLRCVRLFGDLGDKLENEIPNDPFPDKIIVDNNCSNGGICVEKCDGDFNSFPVPNAGIFIVDLAELTSSECLCILRKMTGSKKWIKPIRTWSI
jgi:hypothetical protein